MDYATNDYCEFYLHSPSDETDDSHPRIIMRTTDGYVIFGKHKQIELRKLLNQIDIQEQKKFKIR
jgi:hypothetical protein